MLKDKTIVLGVTGGIAAYKSADLVSRLKKQGANVEVIMTEAATHFVAPLTFQTMSNNVVHKKQFTDIRGYDVEHISLAQKADLIVVAPATANTIGKISNGIADNLLTTVIMATDARVLIAPAMNTKMYQNRVNQKNMERLADLGYEFISPGSGLLACGDVGEGRMAEPEDIVEYIIGSFIEKDLKGVNITITAGPTIEPLDPVRFLSNRSSGRMGYEIARDAVNRGAEVNLITGPSKLTPPKGVNLINVERTEEMMGAVGDYFFDTDVLIKAAAPSDYRPTSVAEDKIKKTEDDGSLKMEYVENPDIVAYYGNKKDKQIVVGFAAETTDLEKHAGGKVKSKNLDFIVANDVTKEGAGFDVDTNIVSIIDDSGNKQDYPKMKKSEVGKVILDRVKDILVDREFKFEQ